jgi:DNA-binding GntR family transcriptional regulator
VVSRLELDQVFHLYEVRAVLEGMCVRLATRTRHRRPGDEFVHLFGEPMDGFVRARDFDSFIVSTSASAGPSSTGRAIRWPHACSDSIYDNDQRRDPADRDPARAAAQEGLGEHRAVVARCAPGDAGQRERLKRMNLLNAQATLRWFHKYVL